MSENSIPYKVSLCRKTTCCPELTIDGNKVIITDDFDGKVKMTIEQMEILLSEALNHPLINLTVKLTKEQIESLVAEYAQINPDFTPNAPLNQ